MAASLASHISFESGADDFASALAGDPSAINALLATRDGQAIGVLTFFTTFSTWRGKTGVYVQDIFVDESARGAGIGHRLLAAASRRGVELGADHLRLSVDQSNLAARAFYEHRQFDCCADERIYMLAGDAFRQFGIKQ
jgi:GNAT superfamily N-acetyltransferase